MPVCTFFRLACQGHSSAENISHQMVISKPLYEIDYSKLELPMKKIIAYSFIMSAAFLFIHCNGSSGESQKNFEEEQEDLLSELSELRGDLDSEIEDLSAEIEEAGDEAGENLQAALEELRVELSEVEEAIDTVEESSEEAWESVKSNTEAIVDSVSKTNEK